MKKILILLSIFLLSILLISAGSADTVIIHTNDVHGKINSTIGYSGVAAYISDCKAAGDNVIVVSAGDELQGDQNINQDQGNTAVNIMNKVGYQAMAIGNHDVDYNWQQTLNLAETANFPFLAANIFYSNTTQPVFQEDLILDTPEMKIGIFGISTPETKTKTLISNVIGIEFFEDEEMYAIAQNEVDKLRRAGCDYIICLSHLGTDSQSIPNRSIDLAENVNGIDLIVDGHSHTEYPQGLKCGQTLIVSTGKYLENIGVVRIADGKTTAKLVSEYTKKIPELHEIISEIVANITEKYHAVIGKTDYLLNGERNPGVRSEETNLGDLIADSFIYAAKQTGFNPDCAIARAGSIRMSIPPGNITQMQILNVLPSDFHLYLAEVSGDALIKDIEANTGTIPLAESGFPQVSGIVYTIDASKEYVDGEVNRVTIHSVGGKPFNKNETYTLVSTDRLLFGGDKYQNMMNSKLIPLNESYDSALMNYISEKLGGHVGEEYAKPQGRISIISGSDVNNQTGIVSQSGQPAKTPAPIAGLVLAFGFSAAVLFFRRR